MELYHQNSLLSIIYKQRSSYASLDQTPTHLSIKTTRNNNNHDEIYDDKFQEYLELGQFSSPVPASPARPRVLPPPSPESPWTCSPLQTPSPSLLYHCIASLHRHDSAIYSIAVSNGVVFNGSDSRRIRSWRQPDCTERGLLKAKSGEVRAFLAHGDTLFICHKDNKIRIWNFNNFAFKKVCSIPRTTSLSFFFFFFFQESCTKPNDTTRRAFRAWGTTMRKGFSTPGRKIGRSRPGESGAGNALARSWLTRTKSTTTGQSRRRLPFHLLIRRLGEDLEKDLQRELSHFNDDPRIPTFPVNAIALSSYSPSSSSPSSSISSSFSFGSGFLYSGSTDGKINFWERERTSYRFNHGGFLQGHRFSVLCLVAVEKMVFSGSEDTTIRIWRREEGSCLHECLAVLEGHRGPVRCLAACLEVEKVVMMGFLVYSASLDQTLKVWRVKVLSEEEITTSERIMVCADYDFERSDSRKTAGMEYEATTTMSPVSSPSWVEIKKR